MRTMPAPSSVMATSRYHWRSAFSRAADRRSRIAAQSSMAIERPSDMVSFDAIEAIRRFSSTELAAFVAANASSLLEDEALALLDNVHCTAAICGTLARNQRLTAFYSVRLRLVRHRATPLTHAVKLVHYLHWPDLLRLSVDVTVQAQVRRAID